MSSPATPPSRPADPSPDRPARARFAPRARPDADFELMLALRGAARARDLRNRVVRPRTADTRPATASPAAATPAPDATAGSGTATDRAPDGRDLAHPN